jgi:type I restriction enzyme S subunit
VPTQRRISAIVKALDDLINNNRRRIALLDKMAQAIYREWFVNFRYPGHEHADYIESPAGRIPSNWDVVPLFDEADVQFGFALKSSGFGPSGRWPVIRIRDLPEGATDTFTDEFPGQRYLVDDGDSLIGMDGEFHMCRWSGGPALLNQRVTRLRPKGRLGPEVLHRSLLAPIRELNEQIVGTTVAHLGKSHLERLMLVVPPLALSSMANDCLNPLGSEAIDLRLQNRILERIRSGVLPRLVTGRCDLSDLDLADLVEEGTN